MKSQPETLHFADLLGWVEAETGCVAQFHDLSGVTLLVPQLKLPARWHYHHGPYCEFMKRQGCQPACARIKDRSLTVVRRRRRPFCGVCPQGIWDLVLPVEFDRQLAGVLYLGSLATRAPMPAPGTDAAYVGPALPAWQPGSYARLLPWAEMLARVMQLILRQWRQTGGVWRQAKTAELLQVAVRGYIEANYHENIGLADLAAQLGLHPNYLGQRIQAGCGQTFRQMLSAYRVEKAKVLLRDGNHSVTAAAYGCGFQDSNYFSTVFRAQVGQTPRAYASGRSGDGRVKQARTARGRLLAKRS